jgi:hypothetical protein
MWPAIVTQILIPELMKWLRERQANGQPMPTDAEAIARLHTLADAVLAEGKDFLASKGVTG